MKKELELYLKKNLLKILLLTCLPGFVLSALMIQKAKLFLSLRSEYGTTHMNRSVD